MSYDIDSPEFKRYLLWEADQIIIQKLKEEIEQAKKILSQCNPYELDTDEVKSQLCKFCNKYDYENMGKGHADDCEYARLTGG